MVHIIVFLRSLGVKLEHVLSGEAVVNFSQSVRIGERHAFESRVKGGGELLELGQCVTYRKFKIIYLIFFILSST